MTLTSNAKQDAQRVEFFKVGDLKFTGRKPAYNYLREILKSHDVGHVFTGREDRLFRAVVEMHPRAGDKIGIGIQKFRIDKGIYGTQGLSIIRKDGSIDDLSLKKCIFGNLPHRTRVMRALRRGIAQDILDLKKEWYRKYAHGCYPNRMRCAISGKYIKMDKGHMDHIPPMTFEVLAITFLAHKGLKFDEVELAQSGLLQEERVKSVGLENEFRQWHANLAQLRFISHEQNHYDEEIVRIKRQGIAINASTQGLRHKEQAWAREMVYGE